MADEKIIDLSSDETHLYFITAQALYRVAKRDGGAAVRMAQGAMRGLAVDKTHVYFVAAGDVHRLDKAGGTPVKLIGDTLGPIERLIVQTDVIYYATGTEIMRAAKDGTGQQSVAKARISRGADSDRLTNRTFVANTTHLLWIEDVKSNGDGADHGRVMRVAKPGGTPAVVFDTPGLRPWALSADDVTVYFLDQKEGVQAGKGVWSVPAAGGVPTLLSDAPSARFDFIAEDADSVFLSGSREQLFRLDKRTKAVAALWRNDNLTDDVRTTTLFHDNSGLYWSTNATDGSWIRRLALDRP